MVSPADNIMLRLYGVISRFGINDEQALGLDTSNVTVETVPLVINNRYRQRITQRQSE